MRRKQTFRSCYQLAKLLTLCGQSMDGSSVFSVAGGMTAFAIIWDLLNPAQLRPWSVCPTLRCQSVSVTLFVTISPQTPHTQRYGMQPALSATPRSCRGFRRLYAGFGLPPTLAHVGLRPLASDLSPQTSDLLVTTCWIWVGRPRRLTRLGWWGTWTRPTLPRISSIGRRY